MCPVHARARGRRTRLRASGVAACLALAVAAVPAAAPAAPAPQPALSADAALDAIGVNTKFTDTTPENCRLVPELVEALRDLRVRHVRDALSTWDKGATTCTWTDARGTPRTARAIDILAGLAPRVRSLMLVGAMNRTTWLQGMTVDQVLARVSRPGPENDVLDAVELLAQRGGLEGMEGANEYDLAGLRTFRVGYEDFYPWRTALRAHQAGLNALVKDPSRPLLADVPLLGPALGRFASYDAYAANGYDPGAHHDLGNLHYYNGWRMPEDAEAGPYNDVEDAMAAAENVAKGDPVVVTEAGYHTAPYARDAFGDLSGIPEDVAATYMPRLLLEFERLGALRTYLFELRDHRNFGPGDQESYFGLLRWDGSRRPAFGALARLTSILEDPGPAFTPAPLSYEVAGAPSDVRTRLFARRDGTYVLALWRAAPVWDGHLARRLAVAASRVGVVLGDPAAYDATVANLSEGGATGGLRWRAARRAAGPITMDLTGDVQLLRLSPRR